MLVYIMHLKIYSLGGLGIGFCSRLKTQIRIQGLKLSRHLVFTVFTPVRYNSVENEVTLLQFLQGYTAISRVVYT